MFNDHKEILKDRCVCRVIRWDVRYLITWLSIDILKWFLHLWVADYLYFSIWASYHLMISYTHKVTGVCVKLSGELLDIK